ncbi:MAG TPA: GNAT family N-acetyltransferase [Terracidiphilus sp.]|jgi:predicted acetyltransferase
MQIQILPVTLEEKPVLANLLELYSHDFCDFLELELHRDGRFGYRNLDLYWTDPGRYPFLVKLEGRLAGFVLVGALIEGASREQIWDMAEFFILRGWRGRGIGTGVAHAVWRRFPGRWQVRVMALNVPAHRFWNRAISSFTSEVNRSTQTDEGRVSWHVFSFRVDAAAHVQDGVDGETN